MAEKLVIVGAGVAGVNAATKLVDNGFPGENITIIDMGKDPYRRPYSEVMTGFLGTADRDWETIIYKFSSCIYACNSCSNDY